MTSYLDDFPTRPENIAICGGGFIKRFDGFAAFPFSEQAELSKLANALSLDVNVVGLKPGEVFYLEQTPVNPSSIDWVYIDKVQHELLTKELENFIKFKRKVSVVESVMADYVNESEYKSALLLAEQELKKITKSLLLFITGKKAVAIKGFKGRRIKARRLVFVFRSDALGLRSAYSLNFLNGKFEFERHSEESYLTENYPFGVDLPLVDFIGMVAGELQIWDIVGVSIKSWFEGGIFDGIIPFFYSYYGENGSPELLGKIIERKLRAMELSS